MMRDMDKNKELYRNIIIYTYLLIFIVILLYEMPGLYIKREYKLLQEEKVSHEDYVSGRYMEDKEHFNTKEMFFPIALPGTLEENIYFSDSYGADRTYGGDRSHEGCDIMTYKNIRGEFPVVAICDGVIEQMGWLELGGYRIGLRSQSGVYYYYAHLSAYEDGISEGMKVHAGQVLGYIGDTGYSKVEGTTGNFDVHLHFGIYLYDTLGNEYTVNPYPLLKKIEKSVIKYSFNYQ